MLKSDLKVAGNVAEFCPKVWSQSYRKCDRAWSWGLVHLPQEDSVICSWSLAFLLQEKLIAKLKEVVPEFYSSNPKTSDSFGRIINDRHFKLVGSLLPPASPNPPFHWWRHYFHSICWKRFMWCEPRWDWLKQCWWYRWCSDCLKYLFKTEMD